MKKLVLLLLTIAVIVPAFAIDTRLGGAYSTSDPEKIYIRVKVGTGTAAAGTVMGLDLTADDGVTANATTGAGSNNVLCVMVEAVTTPNFGLCQVHGYHPGIFANGTVSAITAGGRLETLGLSGFVNGANTTNAPSIGIALDALSSSGTVEAYIQLL